MHCALRLTAISRIAAELGLLGGRSPRPPDVGELRTQAVDASVASISAVKCLAALCSGDERCPGDHPPVAEVIEWVFWMSQDLLLLPPPPPPPAAAVFRKYQPLLGITYGRRLGRCDCSDGGDGSGAGHARSSRRPPQGQRRERGPQGGGGRDADAPLGGDGSRGSHRGSGDGSPAVLAGAVHQDCPSGGPSADVMSVVWGGTLLLHEVPTAGPGVARAGVPAVTVCPWAGWACASRLKTCSHSQKDTKMATVAFIAICGKPECIPRHSACLRSPSHVARSHHDLDGKDAVTVTLWSSCQVVACILLGLPPARRGVFKTAEDSSSCE